MVITLINIFKLLLLLLFTSLYLPNQTVYIVLRTVTVFHSS